MFEKKLRFPTYTERSEFVDLLQKCHNFDLEYGTSKFKLNEDTGKIEQFYWLKIGKDRREY